MMEAVVGNPAAIKAALVGANTVKGPALLNTPATFTLPWLALSTAATRYEKLGLVTAVSTIFPTGGIRMRSITWITPLRAIISADTTDTPLMYTPELLLVT